MMVSMKRRSRKHSQSFDARTNMILDIVESVDLVKTTHPCSPIKRTGICHQAEELRLHLQ